MLEQCFRVLGENKLKKMLPDELKDVPFDEIKKLCWEQLEQLSSNNLLEILEGREVTEADDAQNKDSIAPDSQQDNNVDSTSSVKENSEGDEIKQGGGSGEESDVLSINADADDSDIEGPKEEKPQEVEEQSAAVPPTPLPTEEVEETMTTTMMKKKEEEEQEEVSAPRLELQQDIERSVSEILALSVPVEPPAQPVHAAPQLRLLRRPPQQGDFPSAPAVVAVPQPSTQQLELLELEMRARAIKALMKANDPRKQALGP